MKTTVEIPDELFRQVKAEAVFQGISFKDYLHEILERRHELFRSATQLRTSRPSSDRSVTRETTAQYKPAPADSADDSLKTRRELPRLVEEDVSQLPSISSADVKAIEEADFLERFRAFLPNG